jgi:hypothetical protein
MLEGAKPGVNLEAEVILSVARAKTARTQAEAFMAYKTLFLSDGTQRFRRQPWWPVRLAVLKQLKKQMTTRGKSVQVYSGFN